LKIFHEGVEVFR
ncbi:hypothetical protein D030_0414B, partial [Vibrio parahaemolyticus AQ3810]